MNKLVFTDSFDYGVDDLLANIVDDPDVMSDKVASEIREQWGEMAPEKDRTLVHIIALGSFEKVGFNANADGFEEEVCRKSHPDFVKKARLYRHHKKTPEEDKDGDVVKSAYNEKMGRVELVVSAKHDKCADWLGEVEKGNPVCFSMGWSCFDPSAKVKTIDGYKEIKDITTEDLVLDHNAKFSKVVRNVASPLGDRKVLSIKGHTWHDEILATNDHKILALKKQNVRWDCGHLIRGFDPSNVALDWIEAENLSVGDYMVRPVIKASGLNPIDNDTAYMLGQYLGDGNATKNTDHSVVITTHVNDEEMFNKMVSICLRKKWNFTVYHLSEKETHRKKMARTLRIRDPRFTIMCKDLCGELGSKKLDYSVWGDWTEENFKHFLGGYIDADGSYDSSQKHIRMSTVLDDIADTIQQAMLTIGVPSSAWKDFWKPQDGESNTSFKNKKDYAWVVYVPPSSAHILNGYSTKVDADICERRPQAFFIKCDGKKYLACKIKEIKTSETQSQVVHCLEVFKSHSFTVSGFVVHNCTDGDICSLCSHRAHKRSDYCLHLHKNAEAPYGLGKILPDGRQCGTFNRDGYWNDISYVNRGADMTAMDLAKIASINPSSNIGGAELAELMGYCDNEAINYKKAFAEKIYNIVGERIKNGNFSPLMVGGLTTKNASGQLSDYSPKEVFSFYKYAGCVMPFEVFCQKITPKLTKELQSHIKNAQDNFSEYASEILSDRDRLIKVSKVGTFDSIAPQKLYISISSNSELNKLSSVFGEEDIMTVIEPSFSKKATSGNNKTKVAEFFVESYIAYKISSLADQQLDDQKIFDSFLLN